MKIIMFGLALLALAAPAVVRAQASIDGQRVSIAGTPLPTAMAAKESTSNKGAANGYAGLDLNGKVPASESIITSVAGRSGAITISHSDITDWTSTLAPYALTSSLGSAAYHLATDFDTAGAAAAAVAALNGSNITSGTVSVARLPTGTSGATLPLLNGVSTWSGAQTFGAPISSPGIQLGVAPLNMSGSGPSLATTRLFENTQTFGTVTGSGQFISPHWRNVRDDTDIGANNMWALDFRQVSLGPDTTGEANVGMDYLQINTTPAGSATYVVDQSQANATVPDALGLIGGANFFDYQGSLFAGNDNVFFGSGATNWLAITGREIDVTDPVGASAAVKLALSIVLGSNDRNRGVLDDAGLTFGAQQSSTTPGWATVIRFGGVRSLWPGSTTTDLIGAMQRRYSLTGAAGLLPAQNGVHFNEVGFTGNAFDSPGFAVDANAKINAASLNAPQGITMQTASVAGVSVGTLGGVQGGEYVTPPTLFFGPPLIGGVQAAGVVASMALTHGVEATAGFACSNGDTYQVSSGPGTPGVISLIVPTPGAGVTGYTITSPGSYTNANMATATMSPVSSTCTSPPGFTWYAGIAPSGIAMTNNGLSYSPNPPPAVWAIGGGGLAGAILTTTMGSLTTSPFTVDALGNVTAANLGSASSHAATDFDPAGAASTAIAALPAAARSGAYSDLTGKPTLATVATSGAYGDLSGKPTIVPAPTPSLANYGTPVADGVTDNTALYTSLNTAGGGFVPLLTAPSYTHPVYANMDFQGSVAINVLSGRGRIKDLNGNLRAPSTANITADPPTLSNYNANSNATAFNADYSKVHYAFETRIGSTVATSGTGVFFPDQVASIYGSFINNGGVNSGVNVAGPNRSEMAVIRLKIQQNGQGDLAALWPNCIISKGRTTLTGVTNASWNGEPACSIIGGGISASVNNVYENTFEAVNADNGYDVAEAGRVNDMNRTNATGGLDQVWFGDRQQSYGTAPVDAFYSGAGPTYIGLHLDQATSSGLAASYIPTIATAGTGVCVVGDELRAVGGTFQKPMRFRVTSVDGSSHITGVQIWLPGMYSVPPTNPISVTAEPYMATPTCTDSTFNVSSWVQSAGATLASDQRIYWNAVNPDTKSYPTTTNLNREWTDYDATSGLYRWTIGGVQAAAIGKDGVHTSGASPSLTLCGTSPSAANATDMAGTVTVGSGATGCIVAFNSIKSNAPTCNVTFQSGGTLPAYSESTSALSVTFPSSVSGAKFDYQCVMHN